MQGDKNKTSNYERRGQYNRSSSKKSVGAYLYPDHRQSQVDYMLDKFQSAAVVWESIEASIYDYRLAYIEDQLVGYLAFQQKEAEVFISKLYVDPDRQKQGIAKRLFAEVSDQSIIRLTVNKYNTVAIQVYEHIGFEKEEAVVAEIGKGYVMDDYVMVRRQ
ncbi:GNAT family N-acetyltransferase [Listeria grayi]|uniref:N-acetyltransferase GCN5 n=1 Tax=Listeria grayi FSL F6-1183 TaxID=1265827 RepID=A0A829R8N2_LISGR|nr:GNAT family N-acetyltransferase [Listeria grayi]EUJ29765.1 N-acetyltransferase GCN5 [Listeria grayi FSL F6-1183]